MRPITGRRPILVLPDERLSDEAFRTRLSHYLPSFGGTPGTNPQRLQISAGDRLVRRLGGHQRRTRLRPRPKRPGVRIGIEDWGVDILHPEFAGRVQRRGAFIVNKHSPQELEIDSSLQEPYLEFLGCREEGAGCRVFEIEANGDRALIEHYAHRIIEAERRFPDEDRTWFIRDLSHDIDGWYAIPRAILRTRS